MTGAKNNPWDQTGSPEIPDREETEEIPQPPFGGGNVVAPSELLLY